MTVISVLPYGNARSIRNYLIISIFIFFRRGFTLEEALQMVYEDDLAVDQIFIDPPEPNILTDEESGDEEDDFDINRLPGRQLSARAEIVLHNNQRIGGDIDMDDGANKEDESCTTPRIVLDKNFSWISGDLEVPPKHNKMMIPDNKNGLYKNMNPTELFELFFDENVINLLVEESMRYASSKNAPDFVVTKDEIKCFLGILLVSGYNPHPGKRFYWDSRPDMNNQAISQSMRRNRFFQIMKYIHCADNNNIDVTDSL